MNGTLPLLAGHPETSALCAFLRRCARAAALVVVLVGGVVLFGWVEGIETFKSLLPGLAAMKANTALGLALCGLALGLLAAREAPSSRARAAAFACAAASAALGLLTLVEYVSGVSLGIDQLLIEGKVGALTASPGRMAAATAAAFALLGGGLVPLALGRAFLMAQGMAAVGGVVAGLSMAGELYGFQGLDAFWGGTHIAVHTAAAFVVLALGALAINPESARLVAASRDRVSWGLAASFGLILFIMGGAVLNMRELLAANRLVEHTHEVRGMNADLLLSNATICLAIGTCASFLILALCFDALRREVAQRKTKMKELLRAGVLLEASNKELEAFSYSVSHDLRAPLRAIDGFSQILLEDYADKLDDPGREHLARMRAASQRMARLIDDLLGLGRVARAEMRRERVDLSALASAVVEDLRRAEPERRVEVSVAPGLVAQGDGRLLRLVLQNLIDNAWKFTSKTPQARIEVDGVRQSDGTTAYFVRDNGAGFDEAYAHKLFGVFQRLHAMTEYPGTGVGLATAQRIVSRHGGRVWAQGKPGQGATFCFSI